MKNMLTPPLASGSCHFRDLGLNPKQRRRNFRRLEILTVFILLVNDGHWLGADTITEKQEHTGLAV